MTLHLPLVPRLVLASLMTLAAACDASAPTPDVLDACFPDCEGHQCGDDGCGGSCGTCEAEATCNDRGRCVLPCQADCTDRVCGGDGCGGSCGDCDGGLACLAGTCVEAFTCSDGRLNGRETDRDCGGGDCPACSAGRLCHAGSDCSSGTCGSGLCTMPATCSNREQDGKETAVDCGGGDCGACAVGDKCTAHGDCLSESCQYGICALPTCEDGLRNQGEGDADCGGPCSDPCGDGRTCGVPGDCAGGACVEGTCCVANACGTCGSVPAETCDGLDNDCNGTTDTDAAPPSDPACPLQAGVCQGSTKACAGAAGWICDAVRYRAYAWNYEVEETLCDRVDNDCDGTTDAPEGCCKPSCVNRLCGSDGCGGSCGTCQGCNGPDDSLCEYGLCDTPCCPKCSGRQCGPDGCKGTCGTCPDGQSCNTQTGQCITG